MKERSGKAKQVRGEGRTQGRGAAGRQAAPRRAGEAREAGDGLRLIEGWNPVLEALRAGRRLERIWLAADRNKNAAALRGLAAERGVPVEVVERTRLERMAASAEHQGVLAWAPPYRYSSVDDILAVAAERGEPPFLLILDHIEDPQNLGSLIRTAECAGVHGAIIPSRRAAGITPAVGKASAGAIEYLPVAQVSNLVQEMDRLKEQGIWMVGAHMAGEKSLFEADLSGPVGLVIGAEGKGLSRLVAEHCDILVRIPMAGRINSLNASVAGALLMYEVVRRRLRGA